MTVVPPDAPGPAETVVREVLPVSRPVRLTTARPPRGFVAGSGAERIPGPQLLGLQPRQVHSTDAGIARGYRAPRPRPFAPAKCANGTHALALANRGLAEPPLRSPPGAPHRAEKNWPHGVLLGFLRPQAIGSGVGFGETREVGLCLVPPPLPGALHQAPRRGSGLPPAWLSGPGGPPPLRPTDSFSVSARVFCPVFGGCAGRLSRPNRSLMRKRPQKRPAGNWCPSRGQRLLGQLVPKRAWSEPSQSPPLL